MSDDDLEMCIPKNNLPKSGKKKSKFIEGVWVGLLKKEGYVVFDPKIPNLEQDDLIALWVSNKKKWTYFEKTETRKRLKENIQNVTDEYRESISKRYWRWRTGGYGNTQNAYQKLQEQIAQEKIESEWHEENMGNADEACANNEESPEHDYDDAIRKWRSETFIPSPDERLVKANKCADASELIYSLRYGHPDD